MPFTLTMPKLSPTMEEGLIVKWHVQEGDHIQEGDLLIEVATDKATVEYNALDGGFLRKILVQQDQNAKVNQPIAIFTESKDESIEGYTPEGTVEETKEKKVEQKEQAKEKPPSTSSSISINQAGFSPMPPLKEYQFEWSRTKEGGRILASPLAKKLAKEKGIDLSTVKGTGPNGRVMSRDLDIGLPVHPALSGNEAPKLPPGSYEEEPLSPMRKVIGEKLQASKTFIPHFYVQIEVDALEMIKVREQLKNCGIKVTFNDFIMRAVAIALKEHPVINSGYDSVHQRIIRFQTIDVAVAVAISDGLITPIVRHADYKTIQELAQEVKALATKAKEGKLQPEEYQGGSFTVSNLGMYGIQDFQAVINPPQAAILAVGGILDKPIIRDKHVVPGKILTLSLSSDHRVIDGADAAKFMQTLKRNLENPSILLI